MSAKEHLEKTGTHSDKPNETKDEEEWRKMNIKIHPATSQFPDGKLYATITIEPKSAERLIANFRLIVDECDRDEFDGSFRFISISGFDITKKDKTVDIKIQALPHNKHYETMVKVSKSCPFFFSRQRFKLSPIIHLFYVKAASTYNMTIRWNHIGGRLAQKYVVYFDKTEIQYINQYSISPEMEICIHHVKPARKHTVQITAKLNNGRTTCESGVIDVNVPKGEKETYELVPINVIVFGNQNRQNHEVLSILNEQMPPNFPGIIISEEDDNSEKSDPNLKLDSFYERAKQLYQLLEKQIDERQKH
ncbi:unnamed protein product [Rotaria magnacalcarata]|uniref:Uncharacterized protein n=3 Tax=Rotaria magnacalcarata TaxID=392030 RepID=A0A816EWB2_9BILA|nr:unnamed protein product [Rotaria magnacalcarata]